MCVAELEPARRKHPPELGNLRVLTLLALEHNRLSGSIPARLGEPPILSTLILQGNALTGSIPTSLLGLSHLNGWTYAGMACSPATRRCERS